MTSVVPGPARPACLPFRYRSAKILLLPILLSTTAFNMASQLAVVLLANTIVAIPSVAECFRFQLKALVNSLS